MASPTFSFGGIDFESSDFHDRGFARYSKALVPETAFLSNDYGRLVAGVTNPTYIGGGTGFLNQYSDSGALTEKVGGVPPFLILRARAAAGHAFAAGFTLSLPQSYAGHDVPGGNQALLLSFNSTSLSVERAVAFQSSLIPPYVGEIGDFVIVDNGAAVVLSVFFNGGVNTNTDSYFFGPNSFGLALMKLKLY